MGRRDAAMGQTLLRASWALVRQLVLKSRCATRHSAALNDGSASAMSGGAAAHFAPIVRLGGLIRRCVSTFRSSEC
eukprot:749109-Alexandrium_andersonii.AAC.1